ncbi:MAG: thiol-disulfide oxidoreductase DCC family protein [Sporolactobacillus sp.]
MTGNKFYLTVFYDNWCPLCIHIKHRIDKIDGFHRMKWVGIRANKALEKYHFPLSKLEGRMHAINRKNKSFSGYAAILAVSRQLPIFFPLYPLLKLIEIVKLGDICYNYIADHRKIMPIDQCEKKSCERKIE